MCVSPAPAGKKAGGPLLRLGRKTGTLRVSGVLSGGTLRALGFPIS